MGSRRWQWALIGSAITSSIVAWRLAAGINVATARPVRVTAPVAMAVPEEQPVTAPAQAPPMPPAPSQDRLRLPQGLDFPVANFGPDGGVRFPVTSNGIRAAITEAMPQLQQCYDEWRKVSPALAGTLKLGFRIAADGGSEGQIDQLHLEKQEKEDAGIGNVAFEGCLLFVISTLRFDAPTTGNLSIVFPLSFSPPDAG